MADSKAPTTTHDDPCGPLPSGVIFVQAGKRGAVAVRVASSPVPELAALGLNAPQDLIALGVVRGRWGMGRMICSRLDDERVNGPWFKASPALRELRAQYRAGNVIWLAGHGPMAMHEADDLILRADPDPAPWRRPRKRRDAPPAVEDLLPDGFPGELAGSVPPVLEVLTRIADAKGALVPTRLAVGRAIAAFPMREHLVEAQDLEHYLVHGDGADRKPSDVVGFYRNQLKRRRDRFARSAPTHDDINSRRMAGAERAAARRGIERTR